MSNEKNRPDSYLQLPCSERPLPKGAELIGALDAETVVGITFLVRQRPGSPAIPDDDYWRKTPPHERSFLSATDFAKTYGAAQEDLDAVAEFARSQGLTVTESHSGRRRAVVTGTVAQINTALGIQLNRYNTPKRRDKIGSGSAEKAPAFIMHTHRGFEGAVSLPAALIPIVTAVIGLDNRSVGGCNGTGGPTGATPLPVPAIAAAYNFPNTGAQGITVAVFAAAAGTSDPVQATWSGYNATDVKKYISNQSPYGYGTQPMLKDIGLKVGTTTYSNLGTANTPSGASVEITCDISILACIAQGANINVYFTENTEQGWEAFLNAVISPDTGDNEPCILTSSFFLTNEDDLSAQVNTITALSGLFSTAAAKGITSFVAAGDRGANDGANDTLCHVQYPASDPNVTCCGGTVVSLNNDGTIAEEWAWSDAGVTSSAFGPQETDTTTEMDFGATGGGVSGYFKTAPSWQGFASVMNSKGEEIAGRGIPDVAGMVGYTGFVFNNTVSNNPVVGTSNVAPLYAGLMAVINKPFFGSIGLLNPTLYANPTGICNDVTTGNNDSNLFHDAPYFIAGAGWDACTGWGSIDGAKLMNVLNGPRKQQCAAAITAAFVEFFQSITGATVTPSTQMKKRPEDQLNLLYGIRDLILAQSAKGREYIDAFYRHSDELVTIFMQDYTILKQVDEVVERFMKEFDLYNVSTVRLNKDTTDRIKQIMHEVSKTASAKLKETTATYLIEIDALADKPIIEVLSGNYMN